LCELLRERDRRESAYFSSKALTFSAFFAVIAFTALSSSIHPNFSQYPGYSATMPVALFGRGREGESQHRARS
jgi:hypothetical protein